MSIYYKTKTQLDGIGWGDKSVDRIIQSALRASLSAKHKQHRMGCAIVHGRKVIATGRNASTTHTKSRGPFQQVHAETNALRKAGDEAAGGTLVIVRKRADNTLGPSKPCDSCHEAAKEAGIRRLVYVNDYGILVAEYI